MRLEGVPRSAPPISRALPGVAGIVAWDARLLAVAALVHHAAAQGVQPEREDVAQVLGWIVGPERGVTPVPSRGAFAVEFAAEAEAGQAADEDCIGYGCSPEQDAELNEAEQAANDDYGPGCAYQLCGDPDSGFPPFACDAGPNGLPVCEGEVPASVGPYYTPDGTLVGG